MRSSAHWTAAVLLLLLTACAPLTQRAGMSGLGFDGPRLEATDFVSFDGTRLGLQHWDAAGEPWAVVIGLHGMDDYANAFHLAAEHWAGEGIATYAYDQRGFGRSPHRGVWADAGLMDEDLRTITVLIRQHYPRAIIAVAGVSMGGAVAIDAFASDRPPSADRLVLLSPAVWGWSSQPVTYRVALWSVAHVLPGLVLTPPSFLTDHIRVSDNTAELIRMGRDPLLIWGARTDALYGLLNLMQRGWAETGRLKVPTLYAYGAKDQVIPKDAAFHAAAGLPPGDRTAYYANGYHLLLIDLENPRVWDDVAGFLRDPSAPLPSAPPPIPRSEAEAKALEKAGPKASSAALPQPGL
ncbi:MAG TPA: alpha/beta fold hydrolase [Caulobacteraceae bacterium]